MKMYQRTLRLNPKQRGCHLITRDVISAMPELRTITTGLCQVFVQHTSASLCINENSDPDVRVDMEAILNYLVPENLDFLIHTYEGPDDMPAHAKTALLGPSVQIPVSQGALALGTWQGIYLCEHRNRASGRNLVISLWGTSDS